MKKILLTLLAIVVVAGILGGAGMAGYRYGYHQGISTTATAGSDVRPPLRGNDFGWNNMPMHNFNNGVGPGFHHNFGMRNGMMPFGRGFGFISPIYFFVRIAVLSFLIWLAYKLFTGWRISFTQVHPQSNPSPTNAKTPEDQSK